MRIGLWVMDTIPVFETTTFALTVAVPFRVIAYLGHVGM